jgi:micrococcal nuclease
VAIIVIVVICAVAVLGVLMGLQQIVTYQAQIALEDYTTKHQAQESDFITTETQSSSKSLTQNCSGNTRCITGIVTQIIDGDTIKVGDQSIRFALASAPELKDSGGIKSKDFIDSICPVGSTVLIDEDDGQTEGSYGRIIGVIYCNGKNLNEELIKSGNGYLALEFCSKSEFSNDIWAQNSGC